MKRRMSIMSAIAGLSAAAAEWHWVAIGHYPSPDWCNFVYQQERLNYYDMKCEYESTQTFYPYTLFALVA